VNYVTKVAAKTMNKKTSEIGILINASSLRSPRMIIGGNSMKNYQESPKRTEVSVGESVRIIRQLQELSQNELSAMTGIPQPTLSAF
jgi:DNA-binding transcriptional regulator YiaG